MNCYIRIHREETLRHLNDGAAPTGRRVGWKGTLWTIRRGGGGAITQRDRAELRILHRAPSSERSLPFRPGVYSVSATPGYVTHFTALSFRNCTVVDDGPKGNAPDNGTIVAHGGTIYPWNSIFYSRGTAAFVVNGGRVSSYGYNLAQPRDLPFFEHSTSSLQHRYGRSAGLMPTAARSKPLRVAGPAAIARHHLHLDARGRFATLRFSGAPKQVPRGHWRVRSG